MKMLGDQGLPNVFLISVVSIMAQLTSFPQQDRIRVLAADNTAMNTQLLVETLGRDGQFNVASPASKETEILAVLKRERSQVALISARQGTDARGGFALSREVSTASPSTRIIMLLDSSERTPVVEAFRAGARGVFCRTESLKLLAKSIRCVHEGQIWANSTELQFLLEAMSEPVPMKFLSASGDALLSAREVDVVRCVAEGLSNREIAQRLTLREHTVKNYLFRIFDKLGVSSRVEVVLYALGNHGAAAKADDAAAAKKETAQAPNASRSATDSPVRVIRR
jgi:two-component system nitrate/nitrite response regulator NarL